MQRQSHFALVDKRKFRSRRRMAPQCHIVTCCCRRFIRRSKSSPSGGFAHDRSLSFDRGRTTDWPFDATRRHFLLLLWFAIAGRNRSRWLKRVNGYYLVCRDRCNSSSNPSEDSVSVDCWSTTKSRGWSGPSATTESIGVHHQSFFHVIRFRRPRRSFTAP